MKKLLKIFLAAFLIAAAMMLTSCSQWNDPYKELDKQGNTVSVRFDAGKGVFSGRNGLAIVDVYAYDDVNVGGVKLLAPNDSQRGAGNSYEASCPNHILGGWYIAKTDADGNLELDDEGNPIPDLSKQWNFETDKLNSAYLKENQSSYQPVITLCAYWIPYTNFQIYANSEGKFVLLEEIKTDILKLPIWKEDGSIDMKSFSKLEGKTFNGAYLDEEFTQKIESDTYKIDIDLDAEIKNPTVKIYTDWIDGEWYKISTPEQLYKNAKVNGCYLIMNDIDFSGKTWPSAFKNNFNGRFVSNNGVSYSISNISAESATGADKGALFGVIGDSAIFENVNFENISYKVNGTPKAANFALFATDISESATFKNLTLSGTLIIANDFATELFAYIDIYNFGIASANGNFDGITLGDVSAQFAAIEEIEKPVSIVITDDGRVQIISE